MRWLSPVSFPLSLYHMNGTVSFTSDIWTSEVQWLVEGFNIPIPRSAVHATLRRRISRQWRCYTDENMTQLVAPEDMWNGKHHVVHTARYHDEHCLYQWRKLHYAMTHRMEYLDNKTMSIHHATHCANQLTEKCEGEGEVNNNYIVLGFYKCRKTAW